MPDGVGTRASATWSSGSTGGRSLLDVAGTGHPDDGVAVAIADARGDLNRSMERVSEEFRNDN